MSVPRRKVSSVRGDGNGAHPPDPMRVVATVSLEAFELEAAEHQATLDSLAELVRYVRRIGGHMEHEDQLKLRRAMALLARAGRSIEG